MNLVIEFLGPRAAGRGRSVCPARDPVKFFHRGYITCLDSRHQVRPASRAELGVQNGRRLFGLQRRAGGFPGAGFRFNGRLVYHVFLGGIPVRKHR